MPRRCKLAVLIANPAASELREHRDRSGTNLRVRLPEDRFCRQLVSTGRQLGIDVYVLTAESITAPDVVDGYKLIRGQWHWERCPAPDILYNRCFYRNKEQFIQMNKLQRQLYRLQPWISLNSTLPGKLGVYKTLLTESRLHALLPLSEQLQGNKQLDKWLSKYKSGVFLKPTSGMQGRGAFHLWRDPTTGWLHIKGRDHSNRKLERCFTADASCYADIHRITHGKTYLLQPYLALQGPLGEPFDLRVLIQKEETGRWAITGIAGRIGQADSITSNLHGGGHAVSAKVLLLQLFEESTVRSMLEQIREASLLCATRLEQAYGRMAELGLDYGVTRDGKLWLLEANSKPGRKLFSLLSRKKQSELALSRPLTYAQLLFVRSQPCVVARHGSMQNSQEVHS